MIPGYEEFLAYRRYVLDTIREYFQRGNDHCKAYEGAFEVTFCYPDYFSDMGGHFPEHVIIELHLYVIGPHRHYKWEGESLKDALQKCRKDVDEWVQEFRNEI